MSAFKEFNCFLFNSALAANLSSIDCAAFSFLSASSAASPISSIESTTSSAESLNAKNAVAAAVINEIARPMTFAFIAVFNALNENVAPLTDLLNKPVTNAAIFCLLLYMLIAVVVAKTDILKATKPIAIILITFANRITKFAVSRTLVW